MRLFEAQMGQLLLIDACLHPKYSDSWLEFPPLQDLIEHLQVSFTVLSLDDWVNNCNEDVSVKLQLLIGLICILIKLNDFLVVDSREDEGHFVSWCGREALAMRPLVDETALELGLRDLIDD